VYDLNEQADEGGWQKNRQGGVGRGISRGGLQHRNPREGLALARKTFSRRRRRTKRASGTGIDSAIQRQLGGKEKVRVGGLAYECGRVRTSRTKFKQNLGKGSETDGGGAGEGRAK